METIAVYWEPKIRTYGFKLDTDIFLVTIETTPEYFMNRDLPAITKEYSNTRFSLVLCDLNNRGGLNIYLVTRDLDSGQNADDLKEIFPFDKNISITQKRSADLLSFQGPHYGDRYGIAWAVLEALNSFSESIIALSCSVSCVYVLLERGTGAKALDLLSDRFEIPKKRGLQKK